MPETVTYHKEYYPVCLAKTYKFNRMPKTPEGFVKGIRRVTDRMDKLRDL
jgi:hypothetical protein